MSKQDSNEHLTDKHRSHRPPPEPGKETTHPVGYMAGKRMRNLALHGALAAVELEFADKADKPSKRQLMRIAVTRYRESLRSKPARGMLG